MTGIVVFALFYILAYLVGIWADILMMKHGGASVIFRIAFGGCAVILTGMTVSFVCSLFGCSVAACLVVFGAFLVAEIITAAVIAVRKGIRIIARPGAAPQKADILWLIPVATVILSVIEVSRFAMPSVAAYVGIGEATAVFDTSRLDAGDPMMLFIGVISATAGVHPLELIFTITPSVYIVLYYVCCLALITEVTKSRLASLIAFMTVLLLCIWGYQSEYAIRYTLLVRWYGTGVFVVHGLLNVIAVLLIRYLRYMPEGEKAVEDVWDDDTEEWDMKGHKIINTRNLAIAFVVLLLAFIASVFVLNSKINRLYDATVNLQEDLNKRSSVYEKRSDEGSIEGFVVRATDGSEYTISIDEMTESK